MTLEGTEFDKKSLRILTKYNPDWDELGKDCVAFSNARGGRILIGIEDDAEEPPPGQRIPEELVETIAKRIPQITLNVGILPRKITAGNGGEYIEVQVFRSAQSVASMSDGRYFIRVSDESRPLLPDELTRLIGDKTAYVWEAQTIKNVPRNRFDQEKLNRFVDSIQQSDRVSDFIKAKTVDELLDHYLFTSGRYLTNLGILWIGRRDDRATLLYAPVIQFIKYDELDRKVNKLTWDDFSLNPMELIEVIWNEVPDWRETYELPDGMFRKNVPHYEELVVRELLANALVHRPYTQRGDIFVDLFPDRLEVHNPGLLPLGVTPTNILHTTIKRNEHLARVFYNLRLMEREGSGFDRMYEVLLAVGKPVPEVFEGDDRVVITVRKRIINPMIVEFMARADQTFNLTQRERITLGLVAQHESLTAKQLCGDLELKSAKELSPWIGRLVKWQVLRTTGRTKATEYYVEPGLLRKLNFRGRTSLRGIEKHRLQELIIKDLEIYRKAGISDIQNRIGLEIPRHKIRRELGKLRKQGIISTRNSGRWMKYLLNNTP